MIDFGKYGLSEALKNTNSMDARHAEWIKRSLQKIKPQSAVEIGCWAGVSTLAVLESGVANAHLIDITIQDSVRAMAADYRATCHQGSSHDVLPTLCNLPDLAVIVDGAHDHASVRAEWNLLAPMQPRVVIVHDVTSTHVGLVCHEGPMWLWHQLQASGWICAVDAMPRASEYTQRGLMIATRSLEDYSHVVQAYCEVCN
jgi:hypothetical protein